MFEKVEGAKKILINCLKGECVACWGADVAAAAAATTLPGQDIWFKFCNITVSEFCQGPPIPRKVEFRFWQPWTGGCFKLRDYLVESLTCYIR